MVADWPITASRIDTTIHSDTEEDVYKLEQSYDEPWSGVRDVNQIVVAAGVEVGVRTAIVIPPLICKFCFGFGWDERLIFGRWAWHGGVYEGVRAGEYVC
jgi:hypothetical protein